jgi:sugar/nucleoside kinase (ribokinase family)
MGLHKLSPLYAVAELVACNKEEAERILEVGKTSINILLEKMRALGPKIAIITDGPDGAYAYDGVEMLRVPMYPDMSLPVDRTGAGDATTSTIVAALALGKPLREALAWGPVNAMAVVQEIGAQKGLLSRDIIEKYLADAPASYSVTSM